MSDLRQSDRLFLAFSDTTRNEVSASLIKIRINKLHPCFGSRGSEVQILSPRPFTRGYGLGRSPFFVVASVWYGVGDSLPPTPQENRPRPINSSCARNKPIFNLWHIFGSIRILKISLTNNVVCPTYTHHSRWF